MSNNFSRLVSVNLGSSSKVDSTTFGCISYLMMYKQGQTLIDHWDWLVIGQVTHHDRYCADMQEKQGLCVL